MVDDGRPAPPVPPTDGRGEAAPAAWRVTFEYAGDQVTIVAQQRLAMVAPPDDSALLERGTAGYWVEVRDADSRPLYRQVLSRPIRQDYEVFSPEPGASPQRVAAEEIRGVFQAVVPDLPGARDIVLYGRPTVEELQRRAPRQLVKARLHDPRDRGRGG
jgi:hypothetical protein